MRVLSTSRFKRSTRGLGSHSAYFSRTHTSSYIVPGGSTSVFTFDFGPRPAAFILVIFVTPASDKFPVGESQRHSHGLSVFLAVSSSKRPTLLGRPLGSFL